MYVPMALRSPTNVHSVVEWHKCIKFVSSIIKFNINSLRCLCIIRAVLPIKVAFCFYEKSAFCQSSLFLLYRTFEILPHIGQIRYILMVIFCALFTPLTLIAAYTQLNVPISYDGRCHHQIVIG